MDLFWTPGWEKILTLTVAPTATLVAVWLGQSYQSRRFKAEAGERHEDKVREALADVLSYAPALYQALNKVQLVKFEDRLAHANSRGEAHISESLVQSNEALMAVARQVSISLEQVRLLTKSEAIVNALTVLEDAVGKAGIEAGKVAQEHRQVVEFSERREDVRTAFLELKKTARRECARTPGE